MADLSPPVAPVLPYDGPDRRRGDRRTSSTDRRSDPLALGGRRQRAGRRKGDRRLSTAKGALTAGILMALGTTLARHSPPLPSSPPLSALTSSGPDPELASIAPTPAPSTPLREVPLNLQTTALRVSHFLQHYTNPTNADSVAAAIVTQAQLHNLPPALLVGVLMTEDAKIDPHAKSSVGARGLMQVMPMHAGKWGCASSDLFDITANICHGTAILSSLLGNHANTRSALQAYNGCVHGTNTPNCYTYSHKVLSYAAQAAQVIGPNPIPTRVAAE